MLSPVDAAHSSPLRLGEPTLAPMMYAMFCVRYPAECEISQESQTAVELTPARKAELARVNTGVNLGIILEPNTLGFEAEKWFIWPERGECHDYAVTKRHELHRLGWPAGTLLLAEVIARDGRHHLVLVVSTDKGSLVLDNLRSTVTRWEDLPYRWVRIQQSDNPRLWRTID